MMRSMYWLICTMVLFTACGSEAPGDAGDPGCRDTCGDSCVDTLTDVRHCGACDRDCTALEGVRADAVSCVEGACVIDDACATERADCDGDAENGCEADLTSAETCGACGTSCSGWTPLCTRSDGGGWSCEDDCKEATPDLCGDECVDIMTNPAHCGGCNDACSAPGNATATCAGGACGFECNPGHHLCGDACAPSDSVNSCGTSCTPCPVPANGAATCNGTSCGFTCNTGYMPSGNSCVPVPTVVSLVVTDTEAVEGTNNTASFRVSRTGLLTSPLTVRLTVATTSTATVETGRPVPVDVTFNAPATHSGRSVSVVIPAGASSATFTVSARADHHAELEETVRLTLVADAAYQISGNSSAAMSIPGGGTNVTRSGDSLTDYAVREGSLRLALENARTLTNPVVNASITGPVAIVDILPLIDFTVTVNGPTSGNLVIDGGDVHRIAEIRGTVRFNRVTFRRGRSPDFAAGAVLNRGHLTVSQCRFANNDASDRGSAIYNFAVAPPTLVVDNSVFENNTGSPAISSHTATVSVRNSTFTNNLAGNIEGGYTNLGGNTPPNP